MVSGNTIETQEEVIQPDEVVVTESEATNATPQAEATEEAEFYVDDSNDDQENSHKSEMSQAKAYAMFQKKKKQSERRKQELEAAQEREQRLQRELEELKATVGKMAKGKPPTLEQFDYDESQYQKAVREYYAEPSQEQKSQPSKEEQASSPANDEAEFYLYQREQELSKALPDYEKAKQEVAESFSKYNIPNADVAFNYLANISKQKGVDVAKVIFAMNKSPKILEDILAAGSNDFKVADILANAESKVKTRVKKQIDSEPEPNITNSGEVNITSEVIAKAKKKWIDNPTTANYNAYKLAKTK